MPDVGQSRRTEQRVANGMGDAVGVAVPVEAVVRIELGATEYERAPLDDGMNVVAMTDAKVHPGRRVQEASRERRNSRYGRSAGVVSLGLGSEFANNAIGWRNSSTACASSVIRTPRWAARA